MEMRDLIKRRNYAITLFHCFIDFVAESIDHPQCQEIERELADLGFHIRMPDEEIEEIERDEKTGTRRCIANFYLVETDDRAVYGAEHIPVEFPPEAEENEKIVLELTAQDNLFLKEAQISW